MSSKVPVPAFVKPPVPFETALEMVSTVEEPGVNTLNCAPPEASAPPLMLLDTVASSPPLPRVRVVGAVTVGTMVMTPPVMVSELIPVPTPAVGDSVPVVNRMLVLLVKALVTISVTVLSGRRMPVAESAVANEVPKPVVVVSTSAHGRMPLLVAPTPPFWPMKVKPPVPDLIVATPAPAAVPRLEPRNSTVPLTSAVRTVAALKLRSAWRPACAVTVTTE